MNITRFSIKRPVGISMIVAFCVVLGIYSYYHIGVELLPALNTPYVTVTVKYPGASADSVEQQIAKPIEDALSSVSHVKKMTTTASYEQARIGLELEFSANADMAAIDATKKVEAIKNKLPTEADDPVVIKRDMNASPIVELAVTSKEPLSTIYSKTENTFQDVIQQAGGVLLAPAIEIMVVDQAIFHDFGFNDGPRPDQAHFPPEYIEDLRQFVQAGPP